jgi:hypothetical protein
MERHLHQGDGRDGTKVAGLMRYSLSYRLTVAGGLCALIAGMAAIDTTVRNELKRVISGQGPSPEIVSIGWRVHQYAAVAAHVMKEQGIEHSVLVVFALGAMVILVFMLRIRL